MAMVGGLLTHKSDSRDWRLRRFRDASGNHPVDPNWETGAYRKCHGTAREEIQEGTMIFDIVYVDRLGVVRSAFKITGSRHDHDGRTLLFDKFWYPGPDSIPYVALRNIQSTYHPIGLSESEVQNLLDGMKQAGYREYLTGQIPEGVDRGDWSAMTDAGRSTRRPRDDGTDCG